MVLITHDEGLHFHSVDIQDSRFKKALLNHVSNLIGYRGMLIIKCMGNNTDYTTCIYIVCILKYITTNIHYTWYVISPPRFS